MFRITATPFLLFHIFIFIGGCTNIMFPPEVTVRAGPSKTVYSSLDPKLGQIIFSGLHTRLATEADVEIDGKRVGTFRSGAWLPVSLEALGRHMLNAQVHLLQCDYSGNCRRSGDIGCFRHEFEVSPFSRTNQLPGFWWRQEIGSPSPNC